MSDKNPCPFCGDESEYLRFLDLCAERANEIWRENEVRIMIDVYTSMDFVQVVRCRDCVFFEADVTTFDEYGSEIETGNICAFTGLWINPEDFCAWGERK